MTLNYKLRQLTDHVPVSELARHSVAVEKIQKLLAYALDRSNGEPIRDAGWAVSLIPFLVVVIGPFAAFAIVKLVRRRREIGRQSLYKDGPKVSRGETPAFPIPVDSPREFSAHVASLRCVCGASFALPIDSSLHESLIFDGHRVLVMSLKCDRCARAKDIYFAVSRAADRS